MKKSSILELFPFYRYAPEELRQSMVEAAQPAHLEPGDFFYHEGDACTHFALVGSGRLRVSKASPSGRQITLYHVNDGETCLVNVLCTLLERRAPASGRAQTAVEALLIPAPRLREWIDRHREIRQHLFETMALRLVDVMSLVEEVAFGRMNQRLAAYLLGRFEPPGATGLREIKVTHDEIAAELGTAREVVSRLLEDFQRTGALELARGRIALKDSIALHRVAGRDRPWQQGSRAAKP